MSDDELRIIGDPDQWLSELEKFASWFHQDWELIFPDVREGALMYRDSLSHDRRVTLVKELQDFLNRHAGEPSGAVLKAWFRLGAEGWQRDLEISETLRRFIDVMLEGMPNAAETGVRRDNL